jgi:hypothetical protein
MQARLIQVTVHDDGSAKFTISDDEEDHRFTAVPRDDHALVSYEETCSWRGETRVSKPRESVWKELFQSDEMTDYLEKHDLEYVRGEKN